MIVFQYKDIQYTLRKSERKTTSIFIERDGSVSVLSPKNYSQEQIEVIIESKLSWIYTSLAEWEDLNRTRVQREFVSGEGFPYLGRNYRLKIVDDQKEPLLLKNGRFLLRRDKVDSGMLLFKHFYKTKGLSRITARVEHYASFMGVDFHAVKVVELQNRWASCTDKGVLNFHWQCLMAPLDVLDYIIVHELAHRLHRNHNAQFWNAVDKVMPNYEKQVTWLKFNGAGMSL